MIDPAVILLRQHLRDRDAEKAYSLGLALLAREPDREFLSYATAWGAAKTGRPAEVPALITPAIAANPENFNYRSLRGQAYLELQRFEDALTDFETMARLRPESPSIWNNLRRITTALNVGYSLPRNLTVVVAEIADAYRIRQWPRCGELLGELRELDPLVAEYWELVIMDYRLQLREPLASWRAFHLRAGATVEADRAGSSPSMAVLVRRDLPAKALLGAIDHLIKKGDLPGALADLRNLETLYGQICPLVHVPGICGLFIRLGRFADCLVFLDELESATPDGEAKATFRLRVFPYRQICRAPLPGDQESNPLSDATMIELCRAFIPGSRQAKVASACQDFRVAMLASDARVLADLRFDAGQVATLRSRIVAAVRQRTPLALLRIGDADCYGFRADGIESFSDRFSSYWWGKTVSAPVRRRLAAEFQQAVKGADVIGFPGPLRLARDLSVTNDNVRPWREARYLTLYESMQDLLARGELRPGVWWADEFCNFALADPDWLAGLMAAAAAVVIVSCFEIPRGHLFDQPKVHWIAVPPHARIAGLATRQFGDATLPDRLDEVQREVTRVAEPGVLLLVSAGFGGKSLIDRGRQRGAVAIDFGSAIDLLLGHVTRAVDILPCLATRSE